MGRAVSGVCGGFCHDRVFEAQWLAGQLFLLPLLTTRLPRAAGSGRACGTPAAGRAQHLSYANQLRCPRQPCRERQGVWNTSGLRGPALHLVEGDRDAPNWLSKLEVLKKLLVDKGE